MIGRSPGLRRPIVLATLTASLLCGGVTPAHAQSDARGVPADMIVAPGVEAIATHLPVRVAVRVPANANRLRVRLGRRDVSGRFNAAGASLRVARLTLGDGLRYGQNHLSVVVGRRGRSPLVHARGFSVVRHNARLAQVRIRPGPVTSVNIRVAGQAGSRRSAGSGSPASGSTATRHTARSTTRSSRATRRSCRRPRGSATA